MPHPAWLQGLAPNWGGEVMKKRQRKDKEKTSPGRYPDRKLVSGGLGSLLEKPQHPEAQNVYYTELNKKVELLHTTR